MPQARYSTEVSTTKLDTTMKRKDKQIRLPPLTMRISEGTNGQWKRQWPSVQYLQRPVLDSNMTDTKEPA